MNSELAEKIKWRMAKWLWAPPGEMPASDLAYVEWMKPQGVPVKNKTWRRPLQGRGDGMEITKRIDKINYRGSRSRHEVAPKHAHKAAMEFRGKGAKVERRSSRSKKHRSMS